MTFAEKEASQIRINADYAAIAQLLEQYPWGADVSPRTAGSVHFSDLESLPSDPTKRKARLEKQVGSYQAALERSIQKHDDLKNRGLEAVCDYDLVIAYSGRALNACKFNMELFVAHISYDLSILEILDCELAKLDESVPIGFVRVDAVLTAHQAFMVRKWAAAAKPKLDRVRAKARLNTRIEQRES